MPRKYLQGKFVPRNPSKYVGDISNIVFRSSWERRFLVYCDDTPSILKYSSEELIIPYISPVDNREHKYFVDFVIQYTSVDDKKKIAAIEIKPNVQTKEPKKPKRITESYLESVKTFYVNQAKWAAARSWCAKKGIDFMIMDEYGLGIKK